MDKHLLIVEDDEFVRDLLAACLGHQGYAISHAVSCREMHAALDKGDIDLILLDLGLPDEDGLALTRQVRAKSPVPIIILTARRGKEDRRAGLELGADDYLTKPCDPQELMLRVRNLLGRSAGGGPADGPRGSEVLRFAGWELDGSGRTLKDPGGGDVPLTPAEFNLLAALARAPGRVLSRDFLLDAVSRPGEEPPDRMIDVMISRLRKKLEKDPRQPKLIQTAVGLGYKFVPPAG